MEQIPPNFDAPKDTPTPPQEKAVKLETLSTTELAARYHEHVGNDPKLRFLTASEEVLRGILIEGINDREKAKDRLRAIESGHATAGDTLEWGW